MKTRMLSSGSNAHPFLPTVPADFIMATATFVTATVGRFDRNFYLPDAERHHVITILDQAVRTTKK